MSKKRSANDWDVEQYRHPWDSDEQWEVRRQFMFAHKDTIPEDKLVCLAQVFANMEFLQCSYPTEVAEMVNKLAADIDQDYRKSRKEKQGVAFVKASEDSDISKTFKGNQFIDAEASTAPKRPRWEEREQTNRPNNRPSAADYFERNKHTSGESDELERKCSANKYQIQSYYTSTYKSMQRRQNDMPAASAGGPGELPSQRQEIDVRASGFGTMPVGTLQPANVHPNNENPCQNHLTGRTTAFSA